ncbi:hypothetical protein pb186bvf_016084 [Paramecium bursaria]
MDQQTEVIGEPKTYQEWINQGNKFVGVDATAAFLSYEEALELTEDKFEPYLLLGINYQQFEKAQAYRIDRSSWPAVKNLNKALVYTNNNAERLIAIANEYEKLNYNYIALDIHGLVKEVDPNYDHEIPKTLEDYENIVKEYIRLGEVSSATKAIEKYIDLSENKLEILLQIGNFDYYYLGKLIVEDRLQKELAEQYFERALKLQEDKFELLLRIGIYDYTILGDIYLSNFPELSAKYYEDARLQRPDSFEPHQKIIAQKLECSLFEETLEYIKNLQIPEEKQINLDLGLTLTNKEQTYNEGLLYINKGLQLSQNQFETLFELASLDKLNSTKLKKLLLEKALAINGNDLNNLVLYAMHIYINEERSQETINILNKVLKINPQQEYFYTYKGQALVELGRTDEAIEELKKGAQICPQYLFLLTLGKLLLEKKEIEQTVEYFNMAIKLDSSNSAYDVGKYSNYKNIVKTLFDNNYFEECIKACDKIQEQIPDNDQSYLYKAKSLFALNRYNEAIPILEKTISLDNYYSTIEAKELIQKYVSTFNQNRIEDIKSGKQGDDQQAQDQEKLILKNYIQYVCTHEYLFNSL